ncbi:uncharacterized protein V6R79_014964 [Siganus canaliculatus]
MEEEEEEEEEGMTTTTTKRSDPTVAKLSTTTLRVRNGKEKKRWGRNLEKKMYKHKHERKRVRMKCVRGRRRRRRKKNATNQKFNTGRRLAGRRWRETRLTPSSSDNADSERSSDRHMLSDM